MKRPYILLLFAGLMAGSMQAQTIIELKPGGRVRPKTADDYRIENGTAEKAEADSARYADNLRRAFSALSIDSLAEAETLFNDCLKLRPNGAANHVLHYNLALIRQARGQWADAVRMLDKVVDDHPDYHAARLSRAECNLQLGKAAETLRDAEALMPVANRFINVPADIQLRARFLRAAAHYRQHLYAEARTDLQQLLRLEPANVNAQVLDALCLEQVGQPKEALNRLNFIVAAHPDDVDALSTRAEVENGLELFALAKGDYDRLVTLQPTQTDWLVERARTLIRLGEKAAARRDLDKAVGLGLPMGMVQALYNLTK